jgi:hypothetical protein
MAPHGPGERRIKNEPSCKIVFRGYFPTVSVDLRLRLFGNQNTTMSPEDIRSAVLKAIDRAVLEIPEYQEGSECRGILVAISDQRSFIDGYVLIRTLRLHGCALPVELWRSSEMHFDDRMARLLSSLDLSIRTAPQELAGDRDFYGSMRSFTPIFGKYLLWIRAVCGEMSGVSL